MNKESAKELINNLKIRCSEIHLIMGGSKTPNSFTEANARKLEELKSKENRTEKEKEELRELLKKKAFKPKYALSETAKSHVRSLVKQIVLGYVKDINTKEMEKGVACENDSIDIYNSVFFKSTSKNEESKSNEYITTLGCDINELDEGMVTDIKTPWSKETFPLTDTEAAKACKKSGYNWQLNGYAWLYNKSKAQVAYCLVDTPDYLIEYEDNVTPHVMSDVPLHLRVTTTPVEVNEKNFQLIKSKVVECRIFALEYLEEIYNKNKK